MYFVHVKNQPGKAIFKIAEIAILVLTGIMLAALAYYGTHSFLFY